MIHSGTVTIPQEAGRKILRELFRDFMAPRQQLHPSDWADQHRILPAKAESSPGPFRTDRLPHLREFQDAFSDPRIHRISVIKPSQFAFTTALFNCVFWAVDQRPGPMLFVYPTKEDCISICQTRLQPAIRECPQIMRHVVGGERVGLQNLKIEFDTCTLRFGWSGGESSLEKHPAKYVFLDELDRMPSGIIDQVRARVRTFPEHKIIANGTPSFEGEGVDAEVAASSVREWQVPCPHCGQYHGRVFEGVKWNGGLDANPDEVKRGAWYVCPECNGRIDGFYNDWCQAWGLWVPEGGYVDSGERLAESLGTKPQDYETREAAFARFGVKRVEPEGEQPNHVGWRIHGLNASMGEAEDNCFGPIAAAYVRHNGDPPREWYNHDCGVAQKHPGTKVDVREITSRIIPVGSPGGYQLGTVPPNVLVLTMGVDVQKNNAYAQVDGWGERGAERWLIWHGCIETPNGDLENLEALVNRVYARCDAQGKILKEAQPLPISATFIDSAHHTREVYSFVRKWRSLRPVSPVKGRAGERAGNVPLKWSQPDSEVARAAGMRPVDLLLINVDGYKERIFARLAEAPSYDRGKQVIRTWHFPDGAASEYFVQLTAEQRLEAWNKAKTKKTIHWQLRPDRRDNHYLDAAVYSEAGAEVRGLLGLTKESLIRDQAKRAEREKASKRTNQNPRLEAARADFRERHG